MLTESQVSLEPEVQPQQDNISMGLDGNPGMTPLSTDIVASQQQPPAKKPTRQWAAWTHQEEESFFTALRQVGKNFEKITCRVQSKNKDQVRHYYYRLVRRMNKLLGPGLCLDAKNSKDTNAAMLRWWSLLEKYSCKASKLHLKPRRFKIFIEALEHQILKDQKKNVRKRRLLEENCSPIASTAVTSQSRTSAQDSHTVKLVLVDSQSIQKLGPGKGLVKRSANSGGTRCGNRRDNNAMKPNRQRQKQGGGVSSAAYKKWEKAAIFGVSLVADAAEHLERTGMDKEVEDEQCMLDATKNHHLYVPEHLEQTGIDKEVEDEQCMPVENGLHLGEVPDKVAVSQNPLVEGNALNSMKLKLQLFPIDDGVRRALEMDNHNPHLELTLSTRKKISSVLEHLNRKWGNSSAASGELMLFPYSSRRENLVGCQRWAQDSIVTAADLYAMIGSPLVFRLRYGWLSKSHFGSATSQPLLGSWCIPCRHHINAENMEGKTEDLLPTAGPSNNDQSDKLMDPFRDQLVTTNDNHSCALPSADEAHEMHEFLNGGSRNNLVESFDCSANISLHRRDTSNKTVPRQLEDVYDLALNNGAGQSSAGEWADSLTNISVGDLLSELPQDVDTECIEPPVGQCFQQIPFSCDSFDAAIAAHMSRYQNKTSFASMAASSILDAEQTCDSFSFQKNLVLCRDVPTTDHISSGLCKQVEPTSSAASGGLVEELPEAEQLMDHPRDLMEECTPDAHDVYNSAKDLTGLTDVYWPESLGPLDLDIQPSKYYNEDLILSDSIGGLNRLITSSLDSFQNCSFFGLDKKEPPSTVETHETASFMNFKVGSGV